MRWGKNSIKRREKSGRSYACKLQDSPFHPTENPVFECLQPFIYAPKGLWYAHIFNRVAARGDCGFYTRFLLFGQDFLFLDRIFYFFGQDFRINRILCGGAACFHPVHPKILSKYNRTCQNSPEGHKAADDLFSTASIKRY
jgi:hypothetical protein